MAESTDRLLNYIVRTYAVPDEMVEIDMTAQAAEDGAQIEADKEVTRQLKLEEADRLREPFHRGLVLSAQRGSEPLVLDDRDAEENAIADALIQFLVSFDFAESRTEQTVPGHYQYYVTILWDRLREVAAAADVDLDRALSAR
jgi:hypothetical protein